MAKTEHRLRNDGRRGLITTRWRRFWVFEELIPHIYSPAAQVGVEPYTDLQVGFALHQNVAVRVSRRSSDVIPDIRRAIAEETDGLPIEQVRWMEQAIRDASGNAPAFSALLVAGAAIALSLAAVGVFGLVSYSVSQRMHEVAIRVALGASRAAVLRLLMSTAALVALAGTAAGILGSLWILRLFSSELYGVTPTDPRIMSGAVVLLFGVVLLAAWLPARKGLSAEPMGLLRLE